MNIEFQDLLLRLKTHGQTRPKLAAKLQRVGQLIDQSTLAKWEKMTDPSPRVILRVKDAVKALEDSADFEKALDRTQVGIDFLKTTIGLSRTSSAKEFDLFPVIRAVHEHGLESFTLSDLLGLMELSIMHRLTLTQESVPTLLKLLRSRQ